MKKLLLTVLILGAATPMFAKKHPKKSTSSKMNKELAEYNSLLAQCSAIKNQILSSCDFAPIEAQARQGLQQKTLPGIAEMFTGMGSGGGQRSSAFVASINQAGNGLEQNLAAMRAVHNLKVNALIKERIVLFLQATGTSAASRLLAEFISNNFNF